MKKIVRVVLATTSMMSSMVIGPIACSQESPHIPNVSKFNIETVNISPQSYECEVNVETYYNSLESARLLVQKTLQKHSGQRTALKNEVDYKLVAPGIDMYGLVNKESTFKINVISNLNSSLIQGSTYMIVSLSDTKKDLSKLKIADQNIPVKHSDTYQAIIDSLKTLINNDINLLFAKFPKYPLQDIDYVYNIEGKNPALVIDDLIPLIININSLDSSILLQGDYSFNINISWSN